MRMKIGNGFFHLYVEDPFQFLVGVHKFNVEGLKYRLVKHGPQSA